MTGLDIARIVLMSITAIALVVATCILRAAVLELRAAAAVRAGDDAACRALVARAHRWAWPERFVPKRWRIKWDDAR